MSRRYYFMLNDLNENRKFFSALFVHEQEAAKKMNN